MFNFYSVQTLPSFFKRGGGGGGSKFWLSSPEGGIWKINKGGWKYGAEAGLLKWGEEVGGGGGGLALFL